MAEPDLTNGGKLPWFRRERRAPVTDSRLTLIFTMLLSVFLLAITSLGAFLVLIEPVVTYKVGDAVIVLGGYKYPDIIKGSVLTLVMIGGFTAVVTFWLRISNTEAKAQEANTAIAAGSVPAAAQAAKETLNVMSALPPLPTTAPLNGATLEAPIVTPSPKLENGVVPAAEVVPPKDGR